MNSKSGVFSLEISQINALSNYAGVDKSRDLKAAKSEFEKVAPHHAPSAIFLQAIEMEQKALSLNTISHLSSFSEDVQNLCYLALKDQLVSQIDLGYLYFYGQEVPQSFEIAERWLSYAISRYSEAENDQTEIHLNHAHLMLAKIYHEGLGVKPNPQKALEHLEIPAKKMYPIASRVPGFLSGYLSQGDRNKSLEIYLNYFIIYIYNIHSNSAGLGHADTFPNEVNNFLGIIPLNEVKKRLKLIHEPPKQTKISFGHKFIDMAKATMKVSLEDALSCETNILYLLFASHFQNREAADTLKKIRTNKAHAKLSKEEFSRLQATLAFAEGRGPKVEFQELPKSGSNNSKNKIQPSHLRDDHTNNMYTIQGLKYLRGDGVKVDFDKAEKLLTAAALEGDVTAQSKLGGMYYLGHGVKQDVKKAMIYLRPAADSGNAVAQNMLGGIYANGFNGEQNITLGWNYINAAAEQGLPEAIENRERLRKELIEKNMLVEKTPHKPKKTFPTKEQIEASKQPKKEIKASKKEDKLVDKPRKQSTSTQTTSTQSLVFEDKEAKKESTIHQDKNENKKPDTDDYLKNLEPPTSVNPDKKIKKTFKIKIPKGPKWFDHRAETQEKKEEKKKRALKKHEKSEADAHTDSQALLTKESSSMSASNADSDDKSHWSVSMSESEMSESFHEPDNKKMTYDEIQKCELMKDLYPALYNLINKQKVEHIKQIHFKNSNIIKTVLLDMSDNKLIEVTKIRVNKNGAKINANMINNENVKFGVHATHGSGNYEKWYHNPAIVGSFFEFIALCDPIINDFLKIHFGEYCFSRDSTIRVNNNNNNNNNSPARIDWQANTSKPDGI